MTVPSGAQYLLEFACPSIAVRTYRELLETPSVEPPDLRTAVLADPLVQDVLGWVKPDGWLSDTFHGYNSMESAIRILCEKGVEATHPVLASALHALNVGDHKLDRGIGKVGRILDECGLGGSHAIRAALFARAGWEDHPDVADRAQEAIEAFEFAARTDDIARVTECYRGRLVFRDNCQWPSIYHLRILAFSTNWRSNLNLSRVTDGVANLVNLSPLPDIYVRNGSQLIAPASFAMHDFRSSLDSLSDAQWMQWLHRTELIARLGVLPRIPSLKSQIESLAGMLSEEGLLVKRLSHVSFHRWGAYTGLSLEKDWRSPVRRTCDLTFRSQLIMKHSGV